MTCRGICGVVVWWLVMLPCLIGYTAPVAVKGRSLEISFEAKEGYPLSRLIHRAASFDFLHGTPTPERHLWEVIIRTSGGAMCRLKPAHARVASHKVLPQGIEFTWSGIRSKECIADLTVTVTVRLSEDNVKSYWQIAVQGRAQGTLWAVNFPRLVGLQPVGEDRAALPIYAGRMVLDPAHKPMHMALNYPAPASMQFLAIWGTPDPREPLLTKSEEARSETGWTPDRTDATGLYFATEDDAGYVKEFIFDTSLVSGTVSLWCTHFPEMKQWPPNLQGGDQAIRYALPYPAVIAAFTGDYLDAARLYGDFAKDQPWCARGTADTWPTRQPPAGSESLTRWVPTWFREAGFWAKFYHEPAKVLPEWAAYMKWLQVPISSHYYRYSIAEFDDNYNEMLPGDPYLLSGMRDAKDIGIRPMPYINGVIWDTDTQSWIREDGIKAAIKNESGSFYSWDIRGEVFAFMCPFTRQWQDKIVEVGMKLVGEHGMSGMYLDCLTASRGYRCYDSSHGHPVHGGNYYVQGQRQLMRSLRARTRAIHPQASYFPEQIGEWVTDLVDGYLTLDLQRGPTPNAQLLPLFAAVYHPYTIHFGSDATLSHDRDFFAWEMGQMLMWGSQPLHSHFAPLLPKPGDPNSEVLREVVQAYYQVGQRFLQGGKLERIALRPPEGKAGATAFEVITQPHQVHYSFSKVEQRLWNGPAVLASCWSRQGDYAVILMNITHREQTVSLVVRPEKIGMKTNAKLVRSWPLPAKVMGAPAGAQSLTLSPGKVIILTLTENVSRAMQARPLLETPWELVTASEGPFPSVTGPAHSLWACSDGPVKNIHSDTSTTATAVWLTPAGDFAPRTGKQAAVFGHAAEGRSLPRETHLKPFLLLRQLPFTLTGHNANTVVLSGDDQHLCAIVAGAARLDFGRKGLVIATRVRDGHIVQPASWKDSLQTSEDEEWIVGYTWFSPDNIKQTLSLSQRVKSKQTTLAVAIEPFVKQRQITDTEIARLAEALLEVVRNLSDLPSAPLIPGRVLERVHRNAQALVTARTAMALQLSEEHDWLAPGIPKEIYATVSGVGSLKASIPRVELQALGDWASQHMNVQPADLHEVSRSLLRGKGLLLLDNENYVERVVPVVGWARVTVVDGTRFPLIGLSYLEANRPFEIQAPPDTLLAPAGRAMRSRVTLRNWSPYDLSICVSASGPAGWRVRPLENRVSVTAGRNEAVELEVIPPENANEMSAVIVCTASLDGRTRPTAVARLTVEVEPRLVPLIKDVKEWNKPKPDQIPALRRVNTMLIYGEENGILKIKLNNVRVTRYTDDLIYRLSDPDKNIIKEGRIRVDEEEILNVKIPITGIYTLWLRPLAGSVKVDCDHRVVAEVASASRPLNVYCSPLTRYFYVPAKAKKLCLGARDGGPDEGGRFVITSPTGRVAFDHFGNYDNTEIEIPVQPGEDGKVWRLQLTPQQDMTFWLVGDACPYLSTSPERVIARAAQLQP